MTIEHAPSATDLLKDPPVSARQDGHVKRAARRLPVTTGVQMMVGLRGEVRGPGLVFVDGALWQAHTADESALVPGEQVEVEAVEGLRLTVRR